MGGQVSKAQLNQLKEQTKNKLTTSDIKKYHKFWYELYPDGNMTKEGFKKFSKIAMPQAPEDADVDYLFRAMDFDKNGTISFNEFLIFQSMTAPTTQPLEPKELVDLAFDMYDEDGDGFVTPEEMRDSLTKMFRAKGINTTSPEVQQTINQRIESLLKLADQNGDKKITKQEIFKACEKDPSILILF